MAVAVLHPSRWAGLLLAALFLGTSAQADSGDPLATLGDAAVTEHDVQASLLSVPPEHRAGVLDDPQRIGEMLNTILLRRAISDEAAEALGAEAVAEVAESARREAMVRLALNHVPHDERAAEQLARRLHAQIEPAQLIDVLLITLPASRNGWDGLETDAAAVFDTIKDLADGAEAAEAVAGIEAEVDIRELNSVEIGNLAPQFAQIVANLDTNQLSEPVATEVGYQMVMLKRRGKADVSSFAESRARLMRQARKQIEAQGRKELRQLHDDEELAQIALDRGLHQTAVGRAYVQMAIEEALLASFKKSYLESRMPDIEMLAHERYLSNKDKYRTAPTVDLAIVRVRSVEDGPLEEWQAALEEEVRDGGISSFDRMVKDRTGVPVVRAAGGHDVLLRVLPDMELKLVMKLLSSDRRVAVEAEDDLVTFLAVEDYQPARQKPYADVKQTIMDATRREMAEILWNERLAPYHQLALVADPERIAALRPSNAGS